MEEYTFKNPTGHIRVKVEPTDKLFTDMFSICATEKEMYYLHEQLESFMNFVYDRELRRIKYGPKR